MPSMRMLGIPITVYQKARRRFHLCSFMSYSFTVDIAMWNSVNRNRYTTSMMFKYGSSSLVVSIVLIIHSKLVLSEPKCHRDFVAIDVHIGDRLEPVLAQKLGCGFVVSVGYGKHLRIGSIDLGEQFVGDTLV